MEGNLSTMSYPGGGGGPAPSMWQEARRQEKILRVRMVDHKKRAERRRQYYERIVSLVFQFNSWLEHSGD